MKLIGIEGTIYEVVEICNYGYLPLIRTYGPEEFYLAESSEDAGRAAREYWEDIADNDPEEFANLVGEKNLVAWAMGQWAGPGCVSVQSLEEWFALTEDYPEEHFASKDGLELEVTYPGIVELEEELGFKPAVAYQWN